jgi:hypothetical protein
MKNVLYGTAKKIKSGWKKNAPRSVLDPKKKPGSLMNEREYPAIE